MLINLSSTSGTTLRTLLKNVYELFAMITTIAFDFDGTLVDSLRVMVDAANSLSDQFHLKKLAYNDELRKKSAREIIKDHFGHSWIALARFVKIVRPLIKKKMNVMHMKKGMPTILKELQKRYTVGILTSNDYDVVEAVLKNDKLKIDFLHSSRTLLGKHRALTKFLRERRLKANEVLYVGDEVRDIEACKQIGMKIAAVTWGFNEKGILTKAKPDYLVDTPKQLQELLQKLKRPA